MKCNEKWLECLFLFCFVGNCVGNVDLLCIKDVGFMLELLGRLSWEIISLVSKFLNLIKLGSGYFLWWGRMKGMEVVI